jgi:hypothetical protein
VALGAVASRALARSAREDGRGGNSPRPVRGLQCLCTSIRGLEPSMPSFPQIETASQLLVASAINGLRYPIPGYAAKVMVLDRHPSV